ncbi:MAG TPA: mechanosensitive ion channel family protein [Actinobacteria bacterium]|nr:mechanosensitive ion channel family protein [Actinomycetes bacterium]HEX21091.1 mechanosensitive ion channel family protein [Actinomycetota bacterium]
MPAYIEKIFFIGNAWLWSRGIKIVLILVATIIVNHISLAAITKVVRSLVVADRYLSVESETKRENTLIRVFGGVLKVTIWSAAAMMILTEFGIAIGPLLTAAGIVGVAVGFGSQYLIRDLISGLFIILENQYRVGDVIKIDETSGVVEDISLRATVLRDLDGTAHYIANGEIKKASNMSKDYARVNLNIGVAYNTDLEKVIKVINDVGVDMAEDPDWCDAIEEAPRFIRVEDFADSAVIIKILGRTQPLKQWDVTGELRKRIKIAFDKAGIEIPFPQRVVHNTNK